MDFCVFNLNIVRFDHPALIIMETTQLWFLFTVTQLYFPFTFQ